MTEVARRDFKTPIQIIYATMTGNSEVLAEETAEKLDELGAAYSLCSIEDFTADDFYEIETLLAFISTDSGGLPPMPAEDLFQSLRDKTEEDLGHLSYAVLALGDSYYPEFCKAGKDFDRMMNELGARRIVERVDCDIDFWDDYDRWFNRVRDIFMGKRKLMNS